jgi:hypothetical protein
MRARELSFLERRTLAKDRSRVRRDLGLIGGLEGKASDLPKLQQLLLTSQERGSLIGLGTAFGDVLASELGLSWVLVTDDHGSDHALQAKPHQVFVFPRGMFLKRVGRGDLPTAIDLTFMLGEIRKTVAEQLAGAATSEP